MTEKAWVLERRARYTEKMRVLIPKIIAKAETTDELTLDEMSILWVYDDESFKYESNEEDKEGRQQEIASLLSFAVHEEQLLNVAPNVWSGAISLRVSEVQAFVKKNKKNNNWNPASILNITQDGKKKLGRNVQYRWDLAFLAMDRFCGQHKDMPKEKRLGALVKHLEDTFFPRLSQDKPEPEVPSNPKIYKKVNEFLALYEALEELE